MSLKFRKFLHPLGLTWVGQKWSEKILDHCYIEGAFFLVVQYPIRDYLVPKPSSQNDSEVISQVISQFQRNEIPCGAGKV